MFALPNIQFEVAYDRYKNLPSAPADIFGDGRCKIIRVIFS